MTVLLDTNVLIYAFDANAAHSRWARGTLIAAAAGEGAAINAVTLAELCVGEAHPATLADRIRSWGIDVLDVPVAAAVVCANAYAQYRKRRVAQSHGPVPVMPLPDFFIGAHAKIMGWPLATADRGRFHTYFPSVSLRLPS